MKKKKIIIIFCFLAYILLCSFIYSKESQVHGDENRLESIESSLKYSGRDFTSEINVYIIKTILYASAEKERDLNYDYYHDFNPRELRIEEIFKVYDENLKYYMTNIHDLEKLMEKYELKNSRNFDFSKVKFNLPIQNDEYKNIFGDNFTAQKQEAKIVGKDKEGYSQFDISPDALIILTYKGEILAYAHIDNRLLDTRELMNKEYFKQKYEYKYNEPQTEWVISISKDKEDDYNKYKLNERKLIYNEEKKTYVEVEE